MVCFTTFYSLKAANIDLRQKRTLSLIEGDVSLKISLRNWVLEILKDGYIMRLHTFKGSLNDVTATAWGSSESGCRSPARVGSFEQERGSSTHVEARPSPSCFLTEPCSQGLCFLSHCPSVPWLWPPTLNPPKVSLTHHIWCALMVQLWHTTKCLSSKPFRHKHQRKGRKDIPSRDPWPSGPLEALLCVSGTKINK